MTDTNLLTAARLVVDLDDTLRQHPGDTNNTRRRKDRARLNGALSVWEALTGLPRGEALEHARWLAAGPAQPQYQMVYRCQYDGLGPGCSWSTQEYSEIDAHENQVEPGHLVVGQMERVQ